MIFDLNDFDYEKTAAVCTIIGFFCKVVQLIWESSAGLRRKLLTSFLTLIIDFLICLNNRLSDLLGAAIAFLVWLKNRII